jgi:hypothetical protein
MQYDYRSRENDTVCGLQWCVCSSGCSFLQVASAPLRDDLPANFDAAVDEFEGWCRHLLLAAFQHLGFFTAAGTSETKASIMQKVGVCSCIPWLAMF